MIRGLIVLLFVVIAIVIAAAVVYLIARGTYAIYRQLRREDLQDAAYLRDDESGYTRL